MDTSAWVDFLNGYDSPERAAVAALVAGEDEICTCGIVVAEVFQGLRRDKGREALRRFFGDMVFLEPSGIGVYFRAAEIYASLRRRGFTVRSTIDCLVAALAEESECHVLAKDRDLDVILSSGLVRCGRWRFEPGSGR